MPNTKQAKKRMVQDERRRLANKAVASRMKTAVKSVLGAGSAEEAKKALPEAMKRVDKAAKKGVLHENAASRQKARLARAIDKKS